MNEELDHNPPTTVDEAYRMVAALEPSRVNLYSENEKQVAFDRLIEFFRLLLPEE